MFSDNGELEYLNVIYSLTPGFLIDDLEFLKTENMQYLYSNVFNDEETIQELKEKNPDNTDPRDFRFWFATEDRETGWWKIIADNNGVYAENMGAIGKQELLADD